MIFLSSATSVDSQGAIVRRRREVQGHLGLGQQLSHIIPRERESDYHWAWIKLSGDDDCSCGSLILMSECEFQYYGTVMDCILCTSSTTTMKHDFIFRFCWLMVGRSSTQLQYQIQCGED